MIAVGVESGMLGMLVILVIDGQVAHGPKYRGVIQRVRAQ